MKIYARWNDTGKVGKYVASKAYSSLLSSETKRGFFVDANGLLGRAAVISDQIFISPACALNNRNPNALR